MPPAPLASLALALLVLSRLVAAQSVPIAPNETTAQAAAGGGLSQIISPSFAGMGIEPSNLFSFTGGAQPNQFSINLLANLANYTGVPPHLRIGGNTGDYFVWNETFDDWGIGQNAHSIGSGTIASDSMVYGPRYYEALNRFPKGTPITFGLNMAYDGPGYLDRIVQQANVTRTLLDHVQLVSFEVGNEVDLYAQNKFRIDPWEGKRYTAEWLQRVAAIYTQALKPYKIGSNFFEPAAAANTVGNTFGIAPLSYYGILNPGNDTDGTTYVAAWNQHDYYYYIGISAYPLDMSYFQNLQNTYSQFQPWVRESGLSQQEHLPFVLREMASVGPVGRRGISDTFGAALWTINLLLYVTSLNISSLQIHMTDNSFAAPWQPGFHYGQGAHVRPSYYAFAAMAQLIGGSCMTRVQSLAAPAPPGDYAQHIGTWSVYRGDSLAAVVIVNTRISNVVDTQKQSLNFDLYLPSHKGATIFLSNLIGPGTDATANTTWNGLSYETPDGIPIKAGDLQNMTLDSNGRATIPVRDASAMVIALNQPIGGGPDAGYNSEACNALGAQRPDPRPDTVQCDACKSGSSRMLPPMLACLAAGLLVLALT